MPDSDATPAPRRLRCAVCGRTEDCAAADLAGYAQHGWPRCCGEVMTVTAGPGQAAVAAPEKRLSRRRPAKAGARAEVRRGSLGLGPDLAAGLVDLSEDGACVRLKGAVEAGQEVEVALARPGGGKPHKAVAEVRWCRSLGGGTFLAGLRLRRRLSHADLMDLAR